MPPTARRPPPRAAAPPALVAALLLAACAHHVPRAAPPPPPPAEAPQAPPPAAARPAEAAPAPAPRTLRIAAGGDVMFGRYRGPALRPGTGHDAFTHLAGDLAAADLALVNLETPLSDRDPPAVLKLTRPGRRSLRFRAPTAFADTLAAAGVDVAVLANNHAEDCDEDGLADTLEALGAAGVAAVGAALGADADPLAPRWLRVGPLRVAVLAATTRRNKGTPKPGERVPVAFLTTDEMLARLPGLVRALVADGADVVLVSLHWGGEFSPYPTGRQRALAQALVDAGAAAVLGHHVHVLQPVEAYGDGLILYSMGNLVFDMAQIEARRTALFTLDLAPGPGGRWRPERLEVLPLLLPRRSAPPRPAAGAEADAILAPLAGRSAARYGTRLDRLGDRLVWTRGDAERPVARAAAAP